MCIRKQKTNSSYNKIYSIVRCIPRSRVATYGQISLIVDKCTPRMVGYALANLPFDSAVPWHRVVNGKGGISIRSNGIRCGEQRELLEQEGIPFDSRERIDLKKYRWKPEYH